MLNLVNQQLMGHEETGDYLDYTYLLKFSNFS